MAKRDSRIREKWEIVDGRRVRIWMLLPGNGTAQWRDAAACPPLLLIHGLGCSVEAWGPALRCLAAMNLDRPVYAMDLPGYGKSPGPSRFAALGINELADWTTRFLDVLGIPRVHVAGNSLGCQVALALARRHPNRTVGMALVGPTEGADVVPFWRTTLGLLADAFVETMLYNGTLFRMYFQMGLVRYAKTVCRMIWDNPVCHAPEVMSPCLILRGSRDLIVPEWAARLYAARLPHGQYMEIQGTAHAAQFNMPDEFTGLAVPFYERVESQERFDAAAAAAAAASSSRIVAPVRFGVAPGATRKTAPAASPM